MRRALLTRWPAISRFYGLFPWDAERLTVDELNEYMRQWDQYQRDMRSEQAKARRAQPQRRR